MIIKLFEYLGDSRLINKSLTNSLDFNINLRNDFDLDAPRIKLLSSESDFKKYNYALIVELGRYYFINDITNIGNNLYDLNMEVDLLETYKNDILNSHSIFNRQIKNGDYINISLDESYVKKFDVVYGDFTISEIDKTLILSSVGGI